MGGPSDDRTATEGGGREGSWWGVEDTSEESGMETRKISLTKGRIRGPRGRCWPSLGHLESSRETRRRWLKIWTGSGKGTTVGLGGESPPQG